MRTIFTSGILITTLALGVNAQSKNAVEQKLISEYALTQATADQTDIVTAGAILVLKKGHMVERGTHAELIQRSGFYREVFEQQITR